MVSAMVMGPGMVTLLEALGGLVESVQTAEQHGRRLLRREQQMVGIKRLAAKIRAGVQINLRAVGGSIGRPIGEGEIVFQGVSDGGSLTFVKPVHVHGDVAAVAGCEIIREAFGIRAKGGLGPQRAGFVELLHRCVVLGAAEDRAGDPVVGDVQELDRA
jgi:hypothetical protein